MVQSHCTTFRATPMQNTCLIGLISNLAAAVQAFPGTPGTSIDAGFQPIFRATEWR